MENGVEALKMASGVLIFVLAITITISTFTSVVQALNRIFDMQSDEEYVTVTDDEGNEYYLNYVRFDGGTREVGVETIIPAIYRAYKENYAIYFYQADGTPLVLYEMEKGETTIQVNYIDLEKEVYASAEEAMTGVNELLYGKKCTLDTNNGLYYYLCDYLKNDNNRIIEKLGEYYMDDITGGNEIAEVNKTKKRVITYTLTTKE